MNRFLGIALAGSLLGLIACSDSETRIEYEPYTGTPAYPDKRPKLPLAKGGFGYVSDSLSDTVTVLDLRSNEVAAQVVVGRDPIGIDGPHHLALDAQGNVYVALSYPAPAKLPGPHAAHASSTRPGFVLKLAAEDLHPVGEVQVDANPGEILVSPDASKLLVTHFDLGRAADPKLDPEAQKATVAIIETASLVATGSPPPIMVRVCRAPHGACIASDNRTAYVACYGDDAVAILDLASPTTAPTMVPVASKGPYSAVLSRTGRLVAVGSTDSKETKFLDTESRTMRDTAVFSQGVPFFAAWAPDDSKLWIPTQTPDAIVVADPGTGAIRKQRAFDTSCVRPHEVVLARDAGTLYVVCEGDHVKPSVVLALDPETLETRASMNVGIYPDRLVLP